MQTIQQDALSARKDSKKEEPEIKEKKKKKKDKKKGKKKTPKRSKDEPVKFRAVRRDNKDGEKLTVIFTETYSTEDSDRINDFYLALDQPKAKKDKIIEALIEELRQEWLEEHADNGKVSDTDDSDSD